jgi:hypothetical protein
MAVTITVSDWTDRFLTFYAQALAESDPDRRWRLWMEHYRFLPFGDTAEAESEARKLFQVAWCQYPRVLSRIRRRGGVTQRQYTRAIQAVARELGIEHADVRVQLGVGFLNRMHYAAAVGDRIYMFYPVDYDYEDPELIFGNLASLAFYHQKAGVQSSVEAYDLAEQAMVQGVAVHTVQRACPGRTLSAYLQANDSWVLQCAAQTVSVLQDFLDAMDLPPQKGLLRGFFWESDYLEPERSGYWVSHLLAGKLLSSRTLAELSGIRQEEWGALVRRTCRDLLRELGGMPAGEPGAWAQVHHSGRTVPSISS